MIKPVNGQTILQQKKLNFFQNCITFQLYMISFGLKLFTIGIGLNLRFFFLFHYYVSISCFTKNICLYDRIWYVFIVNCIVHWLIPIFQSKANISCLKLKRRFKFLSEKKFIQTSTLLYIQFLKNDSSSIY